MRTTGLKIIRREMRLTQDQMARILGLNSENHYNMIERAKRSVSLNLFSVISKVSGKRMEQVFDILKSHEVTTSDSNTSLTERKVISTGNRRKTNGFQNASAQ